MSHIRGVAIFLARPFFAVKINEWRFCASAQDKIQRLFQNNINNMYWMQYKRQVSTSAVNKRTISACKYPIEAMQSLPAKQLPVFMRRPIYQILLCLVSIHWSDLSRALPVVQALYVSYEELNLYKVGDRYVVSLRIPPLFQQVRSVLNMHSFVVMFL